MGHDSLVMENVGPKTSPEKNNRIIQFVYKITKYYIIIGSLSCEEISLVIKVTDIVISVLIIKVSV